MAKKITPEVSEEAIAGAESSSQNVTVIFLKDYSDSKVAGLNFRTGDQAELDPYTFSDIVSKDPDAVELAE